MNNNSAQSAPQPQRPSENPQAPAAQSAESPVPKATSAPILDVTGEMEALAAAGTPPLPTDGMMGTPPSETLVAAGKQMKKNIGTVVKPPDILSKFKSADPKTAVIHEPGFVANMAAQVTESKRRQAALQEQMARTAQALTPDATNAKIVTAIQELTATQIDAGTSTATRLTGIETQLTTEAAKAQNRWDTQQTQRDDDTLVENDRWKFSKGMQIALLVLGILALIAAIV